MKSASHKGKRLIVTTEGRIISITALDSVFS